MKSNLIDSPKGKKSAAGLVKNEDLSCALGSLELSVFGDALIQENESLH